jgi:hypothetical protein
MTRLLAMVVLLACPHTFRVGGRVTGQDGLRHRVVMVYRDGEVLLDNGVTQERPEVYLKP